MEPEYPCMKSDMVISWDQHLKNGNVWKANVELSMQGGDNDEQLFYNVDVYVVAPTQELAQYIVATMYPDYESLQIDDDPVGIAP